MRVFWESYGRASRRCSSSRRGRSCTRACGRRRSRTSRATSASSASTRAATAARTARRTPRAVRRVRVRPGRDRRAWTRAASTARRAWGSPPVPSAGCCWPRSIPSASRRWSSSARVPGQPVRSAAPPRSCAARFFASSSSRPPLTTRGWAKSTRTTGPRRLRRLRPVVGASGCSPSRTRRSRSRTRSRGRTTPTARRSR